MFREKIITVIATPAVRCLTPGLFALAALLAHAVPAAAQNAPAGPCERITNACKNAGFIYNSKVPGTGLVIDCIRPIAQNKPQPANAKIPLPTINPQVVDACLAANRTSANRLRPRPTSKSFRSMVTITVGTTTAGVALAGTSSDPNSAAAWASADARAGTA
jgi:hypothetical protein